MKLFDHFPLVPYYIYKRERERGDKLEAQLVELDKAVKHASFLMKDANRSIKESQARIAEVGDDFPDPEDFDA